MPYKVKEVADMVGVSVRTLHHYDQIGLLKPESVTPAGYRLYTEKDLEKLQQVLFFKELGFSLDETRNIIGIIGYLIDWDLAVDLDDLEGAKETLVERTVTSSTDH